MDKNFEKLMTDVGKFGKWQWFIIIGFLLTIDSVNFMFYNMSYLELVPE